MSSECSCVTGRTRLKVGQFFHSRGTRRDLAQRRQIIISVIFLLRSCPSHHPKAVIKWPAHESHNAFLLYSLTSRGLHHHGEFPQRHMCYQNYEQ
ncbi:hypothetical protein AOLI_G00250310 [Acnodon oligacanthus]